MRILADENLPREAVEALRADGHDVQWIRTAAPGSTDRQVLRRAQDERRLLLTFDKDFGELAFGAGLPVECGIVFFRTAMGSPSRVVQSVLSTFRNRHDFAGHFTVVHESRIRMTPLPSSRTE